MSVANARPAGWVYVAWHIKSPGFTKIGYSKWHPIEPDDVYSFKRVHQVSRYLVAFGFGDLSCWSSPFHPLAERIERAVQRGLLSKRRMDVGPSTDIFDVKHEVAIEMVCREMTISSAEGTVHV